MGRKLKTHEEFMILMNDKRPDIKVLEEYVGDREKIRIRFKCGCCRLERPYDLKRGRVCRKHGKEQKKIIIKTHEQFIKHIDNINPKLTILGVFNGSTKYC